MSTTMDSDEAILYYHGLPSSPVLVARTGTTPWNMPPSGGHLPLKELRPVGKHQIGLVWENNLALKLHDLLDSYDVKWTSTDVVRIGSPGESSAPVVLWIGVKPKSLPGDRGVVVASQCQELLLDYGIADVDVEIRESVVARSAGPALLGPGYSVSDDPTVDVSNPLTATLGGPICAQATPYAQGSSGLFIAEGGMYVKRLLLLTARHVVFQLHNNHFVRENNDQPRFNVMLFGDQAFEKYLKSIENKISVRRSIIEVVKGRLRRAERGDDLQSKWDRLKIPAELINATKELEQLQAFHDDVLRHWTPEENRVLGHVILSPPINPGWNSEGGNEGYTEDWAIIEVDKSKVNVTNFSGNAIDLGTDIPDETFADKMNSNNIWQNVRPFTYPAHRLLWLKGTISDEEMRQPNTAFDQDRDDIFPSLVVIKRGNASGVTVGRANNILSYTRRYNLVPDRPSLEWAIFPFDSKSGPFSKKGDSGSIIVDGQGRIGGLLTGGTGRPLSPQHSDDITYATPITFLLRRMGENGLHRPYPISSHPPYPFYFIFYFPDWIYGHTVKFFRLVLGLVWGVGIAVYHLLVLLFYVTIACALQ